MLKIANAMFNLYFNSNRSPKTHALNLSVFSLYYYLVAIADSHCSLLVLDRTLIVLLATLVYSQPDKL